MPIESLCTSCIQLTPVSLETSENINDLWWNGEDRWIAVGDNGLILQNEGEGWHSGGWTGGQDLFAIWGSGPDNIFAAGDLSILHYDGIEWSEMIGTPAYPIHPGYRIHDLWGRSGSDLYACGDAGAILHYNGSFWEKMTTDISHTLFAMWGTPDGKLFAAGDRGIVMIYEEGKWKVVNSGVIEPLHDLWGTSSENIYAVGTNGTILQYNGFGWSRMESPIRSPLYAIRGSLMGLFAAGAQGAILQYDGFQWLEIHQGEEALKAIRSGNGEVFFAGDNATLLRYSLAPSVTVSGSVTDAAGDPVAGTMIAFDNYGGMAVTNGSGSYTHSLAGGWSGTLTPYNVRRVFFPKSRSIESITASATDQAFSATLIEDLYVLTLHPQGRVLSLLMTPEEFSAWNGDETAPVDKDPGGVAQFLYQHFKDHFDFIFLISNNGYIPESLGYEGDYIAVKNEIDGLGRDLFDFTSLYGSSGRLKGIIHLPHRRGLKAGPSLHTLMYAWGNQVLNTGHPSHWGFSSAEGQLGGFDRMTLQDLGGGRYQANNGISEAVTFGTTVNGGNLLPYSAIERYLMGMLPPSAVETILLAQNGMWIDPENGLFYAGGFDGYTIEAIIGINGPRTPSAENAQKHFNALAVMLTPRPMRTVEWEWLDSDAAFFSHSGEDADPALYNFWEAVYGEGTMNMGYTNAVIDVEAGDVDNSGRIDLLDVMLSLQVAAGLKPARAVYAAADVDGDMRIGLSEAIYGLINLLYDPTP